jgi:hypothetical protein
VSIISNVLTIKCNFEEDYRQLYEKIKNNKNILKKIHSSEKYPWHTIRDRNG